MRPRLVCLAVAAAVLAGCGGKSPSPPSTAVTTPSQLKLEVYFFRANALVPVVVYVPQTQAVATAALTRLLAGPPAGYRSELPASATLKSVAVSNGAATADIAPAALSRGAEAQVVYTLTQFPTVQSVDGRTRADFADLTPLAPIFIGSPARGATVSSPVKVSGTADVFEGTIAVDVWSGGKKLRTDTITASAGSGQRGTWSATFDLPAGPAKLVFYEPSAENGQPLHATELDLNVQ